MAASSSSSSVVLPPQHQVFINFRGELRNNFVSHLVKSMKMDGIDVFMDTDEDYGNDLSNLFRRIENSEIALVIFSKMYTKSTWCLNELEKIMECVDLGTLLAIPIFYKVDASDVKNLKGVFGDNFWKLANANNSENTNMWKNALEYIPNKRGVVLSKTSNEGDKVDEIVSAVKKALSKNSKELERKIPIDNPSARVEETPEAAPDSPPLFGIETRLRQMEEMLLSDSKRTRTIGVVGMPGIGKTTLAKMLYENLRYDFTRCVFLPDVRTMRKEKSREILIQELLKNENEDQDFTDQSPESLKARLLSKIFLVVLDNVSDKEQIDVLLGERDWIKEGSLIFITTSDRSAIEGKVDNTYEVLRLSGSDSFQYFSSFAFGCNHRAQEGNFMKLSRSFTDYAKGNPSVLKILGCELQKKDEIHWEEQLRNLEQSPIMPIQNVLRISYNELGQLQKDAFLDVACFFRSGDEYYLRCLVESWDTEPIDAVSEIKNLASKFFINISGGRVEMHDLLYTFGKALGSQGLHRLWKSEVVVAALTNKKGEGNVRGIFLDMFELEHNLPLDKCTFSRMRNLRYLKFYNSHCHRECNDGYKLKIPDELDFPLVEIRYLYWFKFPKEKLPKDFNPKNLIDLNLPYSEIIKVWDGDKKTPKLKWVDLSYSSKLCSLSGLLKAESLQRLNLEGCTNLTDLTDMKRMKSLIFLNMRGCTSLGVFPRINLISMKTLILSNCSKLKEFYVSSDNLETLHLDGTAIDHLPTNIGKLQRLIVLNLKDCKMLEKIPECLGKLKDLQELVLSGCSKIKSFPILIENMKCLQILLLDGTSITDMPKILQFNGSKVEDICQLRRGINGISSLRHLCLSRNDKIINLQMDISQLYHLKLLDLKCCKNLKSISLLPPNLEILDAHGCEKLKTVVLPMAFLKLTELVHSKFIFTNCNNLEKTAKDSITSYAQRKSQLDAVRSYKEGNVSEALIITSFPGSEVPSWFNHRTVGSKLNLEFPPHWYNNKLSTIALCAVVTFPNVQHEINSFSIKCICKFKNGTWTSIPFSCILGGGWIEPRKIDSDHVFIGYTSFSHITNQVESSSQSGKHHKCVPTEASIEFEVRGGESEIVNCGFSLVYEEPNHDATIEGNCSGTSSRTIGLRRICVVLLIFTGLFLLNHLCY